MLISVMHNIVSYFLVLVLLQRYKSKSKWTMEERKNLRNYFKKNKLTKYSLEEMLLKDKKLAIRARVIYKGVPEAVMILKLTASIRTWIMWYNKKKCHWTTSSESMSAIRSLLLSVYIAYIIFYLNNYMFSLCTQVCGKWARQSIVLYTCTVQYLIIMLFYWP